MKSAGSVITFYSYKGGVGRSFALANVGVILASWNFRVLVVDWDIEAPGLSDYFRPFSSNARSGVIDFLRGCEKGAPGAWHRYAHRIPLPVAGSLHLMPATGKARRDYAGIVQRLDWDRLYKAHSLGSFLEHLKEQWRASFDFILIDSRTGITDFSGVITAQLPDALCFLFTANNQSLNGCVDVVNRAFKARQRMSIDRPALRAIPIPSKFELREEYDRALEWRKTFVRVLSPYLQDWVPPDVEHSKIIDLISIPYVPRWTFGEELAALHEAPDLSGVRTPAFPATYALETIAAIIANRFERIDLLYASRDEYVLAAQSVKAMPTEYRRRAPWVLLSYQPDDSGAAHLIRDWLAARRLQVSDASEALSEGRRDPRNEPAAMIAVFGQDASSSQSHEVERFMRSALRSNARRPLVPVVLPGGEPTFRDSRAADYQFIRFDPLGDVSAQMRAVVERLQHLPMHSDPQLDREDRQGAHRHGELDHWTSQGKARWRQLIANDAPPPSQFLHGYYCASYVLTGTFKRPSLRELREMLEHGAIRHTGWPLFAVLDREGVAPYSFEGLIEAWIGKESTLGRASASDLWRAAPAGRFFAMRGHPEDDGHKGIDPGSKWDITIPVWRVGEALLHAASMSKQLGDPSCMVTMHLEWTGLANRTLAHLEGSRIVSPGRHNRQPSFERRVEARADNISQALPRLVHDVVRPMYEMFDFFDTPRTLVSEELSRMRAQKF